MLREKSSNHRKNINASSTIDFSSTLECFVKNPLSVAKTLIPRQQWIFSSVSELMKLYFFKTYFVP
jgi:hypothetical protein